MFLPSRFRPPVAALGLIVAMLAGPATAAPAPSPRAVKAASLPDWSGVWVQTTGFTFDPTTTEPPGGGAGFPNVRERPPYNAHWEAKYAANLARVNAGTFPDPLNFCLPRGVPGFMNLPDQYEFAVTPEQVWMFAENGAQVRRIYTDGRAQLSGAKLRPTYTGNSVGHWEGDTLVARTVGLRDDTILDRTGVQLSTDAVVSERIRMVSPNSIEEEITVEDKQALTRPWVVRKVFAKQKPDAQLFDYACAENSRNPVDEAGRARFIGPDGKIID